MWVVATQHSTFTAGVADGPCRDRGERANKGGDEMAEDCNHHPACSPTYFRDAHTPSTVPFS